MAVKKIAIGFAFVLALYIAGSMAGIHLLFSAYFGRKGEKTAPVQKEGVLPVTFFSGRNKLQGYVYGSAGGKALVVIAHGLGSSAEGFAQEAAWFTGRGYRVLVYDATGSHASEGRGTGGTAQSRLDLAAALSYVKNSQELGTLPLLIYGHSWGGYAAAAVLGPDYPVRAAVSISGYDTPSGIIFEQARRILGPLALPEYPFILLEFFFRFGTGADVSAVKAINASGTPVLIVHGSADNTVRYDGASIIARKKDITNPRVEYLVRKAEGQNGHNDLFMSGESLDESFMETVAAFYEKNLAGER